MKAEFEDDEFDTIGGFVIHAFGRVPKRGEQVEIAGFRFVVLRADSRRLHTLKVERLPQQTLL
jgi:magnesium and cobalt transporter